MQLREYFTLKINPQPLQHQPKHPTSTTGQKPTSFVSGGLGGLSESDAWSWTAIGQDGTTSLLTSWDIETDLYTNQPQVQIYETPAEYYGNASLDGYSELFGSGS